MKHLKHNYKIDRFINKFLWAYQKIKEVGYFMTLSEWVFLLFRLLHICNNRLYCRVESSIIGPSYSSLATGTMINIHIETHPHVN